MERPACFAELLFPLTALITTGFLTRQLGAGGYGLLALTLTPIVWIEGAINSYFNKTTIKIIGEAGRVEAYCCGNHSFWIGILNDVFWPAL